MKILGIDTSCDDTAISILKIQSSKSKIQNIEVLSNIVSSQVKLHAKYGGVYPSLAKREHIKNLPLVFKKAVKGIKLSEIDFIGVTVGPGLEPCLWQGVNFAKNLAEKLKKPLIPVNHIEAHILANFLNTKYLPDRQAGKIQNTKYLFPAVCLVVSGGHTQLILMKGTGKYELIGETRDDAAGECFDKAARILGLGYPGGPAISQLAAKWKSEIRSTKSETEIKLPRPMIYTKDYDFSFSGLKTAVLYESQKSLPASAMPKALQAGKVKSQNYIRAMAAEIQQAIIDVLIWKTLKAAKDFKAKSIILGGGVTANKELRRQFGEKIKKEIPDTKYIIPDTKYCTDNAAMVAAAAYFHQKEAVTDLKKIEADANLTI